MRLSPPAFDDAHALKCELAGEVLRSSGLEPRHAQAADLAVSLLASARATEDAVIAERIAERIAESGLTAEEWWQRARAFASSNTEARPLMSQLAG